MQIRNLVIVVVVLTVCVGMVLTNPTMDSYLAFVESQLVAALDRSESSEPDRERAMLRTIFRSHSRELVATVVRPNTVRRNWGLLSLYETSALGNHIEVMGICGRFIPLKGIDDAVLRLGRLAF
jgi:hypothetical protein